ncbi:MAG TPA: hypothetical protein VLG37_03935 [Candidatus Saccharimonadales bacterium]|nr:hypothetical protein [Candidatus Saccharimonadales bacterium]
MSDDSSVAKDVQTIKYHLKEAYDFYRKFIYNKEHQRILNAQGFHVAGSVASVNWEVFASILTGDKGKGGYGSDLAHHEVKSSVDGNSFEYQYHLNAGKVKLHDDMEVNHIFISYSADYKNIEVRLLEGSKLKATFETWLPGLIENYEGPTPRQRYRKSVSYGFVKNNGLLILKTSDGNLVDSV